ncbi:MAG: hypothetical protein E4H14_16740 [Candidatus Thorarchaeota archaeon]|nr:MAG: hypothetical protein E4H14_16740 [Candidatus Thorarchaeota archaeon]
MNSEDVKTKISTLWIFIMINMLAADIYGFMLPGALQEIIDNTLGITAEFLLIPAVMIEVPIAMIFLSRVLKYKQNRLANIIAVAINLFFVLGLGPSTIVYYFFVALEVVAMLLIVWLAWKWPKQE